MNYINRFLHHVIDAFHPELPTPRTEKCVFVHRDFNIILARMLELQGNYIIREQVWADGKISFFLIQLN